VAQARAEIARRGLVVTVTKAYYGLLTGQRKYATAQQALDQAKRYLDITQSLERGGEVPRSDVVRADFQYSQQEQAFEEAKLAMDNARLDLAVLLFRDFRSELHRGWTIFALGIVSAPRLKRRAGHGGTRESGSARRQLPRSAQPNWT